MYVNAYELIHELNISLVNYVRKMFITINCAHFSFMLLWFLSVQAKYTDVLWKLDKHAVRFSFSQSFVCVIIWNAIVDN